MRTLYLSECVAIFLIIVPGILDVKTLSTVLERCSTQNWKMKPLQVWLILIPVFNIVWQLFVFTRISNSLRRENRGRNIRFKGDLGETVGIFFGISVCVHLFASAAGTQFMLIPTIILWVTHWVKISGYSTTFSLHNDNQNNTTL